MRAASAALWGPTALVGLGLMGLGPLTPQAVAQGQPQVTPNVVPAGEAQARTALATCDRLISYIERARPAGTVSTDEARAWLQASDGPSCQRELDRIAEAAKTGSPAANQAA